MNSKIILCLALVLSGGLFGCSTALSPAADKLDLMAYHIERALDKSAAPLEGIDCRVWQNLLVFSNSNINVSLARSATEQGRVYAGLDPSSLKLRWLKPGELLWISWRTLSQGSGGYNHDGNVILQIHGGRGRELFRDHFASAARAGGFSQYSSSLDIRYQDRPKAVILTRFYFETEGDMGPPDPRHLLPFTVTFTNNDNLEIFHMSKVSTIDTWHYKLVRDKLKFLRGSSSVDAGDEPQPVEDIVKGFQVTRAALESMNPRLAGQQTVTGIVVINKGLKPYEVSSDDGLGGDKY